MSSPLPEFSPNESSPPWRILRPVLMGLSLLAPCVSYAETTCTSLLDEVACFGVGMLLISPGLLIVGVISVSALLTMLLHRNCSNWLWFLHVSLFGVSLIISTLFSLVVVDQFSTQTWQFTVISPLLVAAIEDEQVYLQKISEGDNL